MRHLIAALILAAAPAWAGGKAPPPKEAPATKREDPAPKPPAPRKPCTLGDSKCH